ncbi:hypothetical protein KJ969_00705 [Patescibacteria group bacterium]|nr:hypothetical protein [Patescibacteria group bacterium]MBU1922057.1 hypothetical protein [Patescibacteria group bacterium]
MRLGPLQKYILITGLGRKRVLRNVFLGYYNGRKNTPSFDDRVNAVTKALDKMVAHDFISADGVKTAEKFFIKTVQLTRRGRQKAKKLRGEQQALPLNRKINKS